jgi:hypothetical protein
VAKQRPGTYLATTKRRLRQHLHDQLDALLNGDTDEGGRQMPVLESMALRAMQGFYFNVRVHSLHPDQTQKQEAKGTVEPGAAVGLVRE